MEWWFVISDVIAALTDSLDPAGYNKDVRRRDEELFKGWGQIATPLVLQTEGGSVHKKVKGLDRENLRDHMTDLELIFTIAGRGVHNGDSQGG